jgi:hypothetical protein
MLSSAVFSTFLILLHCLAVPLLCLGVHLLKAVISSDASTLSFAFCTPPFGLLLFSYRHPPVKQNKKFHIYFSLKPNGITFDTESLFDIESDYPEPEPTQINLVKVHRSSLGSRLGICRRRYTNSGMA